MAGPASDGVPDFVVHASRRVPIVWSQAREPYRSWHPLHHGEAATSGRSISPSDQSCRIPSYSNGPRNRRAHRCCPGETPPNMPGHKTDERPSFTIGSHGRGCSMAKVCSMTGSVQATRASSDSSSRLVLVDSGTLPGRRKRFVGFRSR